MKAPSVFEPVLPFKLAVPPAIAALVFLADLSSGVPRAVTTVLDIAALAALIGGVFVVSRLRAALFAEKTAREASESAASSWKEERDADRARADRITEERIEVEKQRAELAARVTALEGRPDLDHLHRAVAALAESSTRIESVLTEIHTTLKAA